jgi:shikimate kinase
MYGIFESDRERIAIGHNGNVVFLAWSLSPLMAQPQRNPDYPLRRHGRTARRLRRFGCAAGPKRRGR